uniref:MFS transporter n=1 Tax=Cyberlindnera americana TaxID=36016 RepID=A0A5P8N8H6_9ASCO|nr:MFS transporter [Cyberlindnera americana]
MSKEQLVREKQQIESTVSSRTSISSVLESDSNKELADLTSQDPALTAKIHLINDALDEIGFTWYHFKLFCLNGMGYAVDSQLTSIQSSVSIYVRYQFNQGFSSDTVSAYAGLLVGAIFWGFGADLIGRKIAFNTSLFFSAIFGFLAGGMGNFGSYCFFVALSSAASGGNLVLDSTVFLEFLPFKKQWMVTFMAAWWGLGQVLAVLTAWLFFSIPKYYCADPDNCTNDLNMGWRYVWIVNSAFVLILAVLRVTVIRLQETPKFLVSNKRDVEAIHVLHTIANKYNRKCSLTLEMLEECGEVTSNDNYLANPTLKETWYLVKHHTAILFSTKKMALSTTLVFASWLLLGLSYPLYSSFLPQLLAARGAQTSATTLAGVYGDSVIANTASIGGGLIGGLMLLWWPWCGRRGVMVIGGVSSMALFFGYTTVKTRAANVGFSSAIYVTIYIYYSCLYAYTPEVMPTSARATGNSIAVSLTRFTGCLVPIIAYYADTSSPVPVWICGAFVGVIGCFALFMPFEPSKQRVG